MVYMGMEMKSVLQMRLVLEVTKVLIDIVLIIIMFKR
ncbi:hypothetical protein PEC730217_47400 [Pectobacterium carotovorum subsp. carotovorum]|nr:hypothetical protein PEC730217_47400 [Pectobacterium carotovorum subsp. carotovorum]